MLSQYKQMFQAIQMMQTFQKNESPGEPHREEFESEREDHKSPADFFREMLTPEQQHMVDAILEQRREN